MFTPEDFAAVSGYHPDASAFFFHEILFFHHLRHGSEGLWGQICCTGSFVACWFRNVGPYLFPKKEKV